MAVPATLALRSMFRRTRRFDPTEANEFALHGSEQLGDNFLYNRLPSPSTRRLISVGAWTTRI